MQLLVETLDRFFSAEINKFEILESAYLKKIKPMSNKEIKKLKKQLKYVNVDEVLKRADAHSEKIADAEIITIVGRFDDEIRKKFFENHSIPISFEAEINSLYSMIAYKNKQIDIAHLSTRSVERWRAKMYYKHAQEVYNKQVFS